MPYCCHFQVKNKTKPNQNHFPWFNAGLTFPCSPSREVRKWRGVVLPRPRKATATGKETLGKPPLVKDPSEGGEKSYWESTGKDWLCPSGTSLKKRLQEWQDFVIHHKWRDKYFLIHIVIAQGWLCTGCHGGLCNHRIWSRVFCAGSSGLCILHLYIQFDTACSLLASCQHSCRKVGKNCHNMLGNSCGKQVSPTAVEVDRFKELGFLFVLKCSSPLKIRNKVEFNVKIFRLEYTEPLEISV